MKLPDGPAFFEEVRREFAYLTHAGFVVRETEEISSVAKIQFMGRNVALSLSLDRRDSCVDCHVTRVLSGRLAGNDVFDGYWGHLHQFLVQRRKYRGALREFRADLDPNTWQTGVKTYARALKALAPEIAADAASCFESK